MLSVMDALMKGAALAVGAYTASLLRVAMGTVIALPVWFASRPRLPDRAAMRWHWLRGGISAFMGFTFFFALTRMPIAEAIAISFIAPLIALYLAAILLGEEVRRAAILGSLVGFAGAMVIVGGQFGRGKLDADYLLGLASILVSTLLYAVNFIVIRKQSLAAPPAEIALFHSAIQAVVLMTAAPLLFTVPGTQALAATAGAAALTVAGAMLLAWAYARAQTQVLVPLEYSGFGWAALLGWLWFEEAVTAATLGGTTLVVIGCIVATRQTRDKAAG